MPCFLASDAFRFATSLATLALSSTVQAQAAAPTVELRNAQWFDGRGFVRESRWVRGEEFVKRPARSADSVVDLTGRWMVPPYGDAHTHSPDSPFAFESIRDQYLRAGVFYVQVLTNSREGRRAIAARVNVPASVDVAYADGAVTATGGHPQVLYESLGLYRRFWQVDAERYAAARSLARDGDTYHRLDSLPQLAPIVALLSRDTLPVLKVMLLDSEHWTQRHRDSTQFGFIGMNPSLLPPLVDAAHRLGRRVWAHIETPYDLEVALQAGVDAFAHVPGSGAAAARDSVAASLVVPESTVRRAGRRRVFMTPVLGLSSRAVSDDTAKARRFHDVMVRNTLTLRRAGVRMVSGSDTYSDADVLKREPAEMARLLGLTPVEELRLRAVDTPAAIFPQRRIAQLRHGFEASALGLRCNPLVDRTCLDAIDTRLKRGRWLTLTALRE